VNNIVLNQEQTEQRMIEEYPGQLHEMACTAMMQHILDISTTWKYLGYRLRFFAPLLILLLNSPAKLGMVGKMAAFLSGKHELGNSIRYYTNPVNENIVNMAEGVLFDMPLFPLFSCVTSPTYRILICGKRLLGFLTDGQIR
jgi:hypothetical protein